MTANTVLKYGMSGRGSSRRRPHRADETNQNVPAIAKTVFSTPTVLNMALDHVGIFVDCRFYSSVHSNHLEVGGFSRARPFIDWFVPWAVPRRKARRQNLIRLRR